tara:strand:+ start:41 stop:520 length:480 start_codon:yes stop_codon:yes gene_type:complete
LNGLLCKLYLSKLNPKQLLTFLFFSVVSSNYIAPASLLTFFFKGLHAAGIKNAKYILIVADPERNGMRGYSDSTTAGADGGDGNNGGGSTSGNSSSFGGGTDHEDVKTLITYLAIDNCLGDIPMHQRPTIVCEAGSTMSMHVLSSRRFARISDQRISGK